MATDSKKIIWKNVQALMAHQFGKENVNGFATYVGIGVGSVLRLRAQETSVGVEIIDKIAKRFDLEPWQLLVPNLVVNNPPALVADSERMKKLLANVQKSVQAMSGAIEQDGNTGNGDLDEHYSQPAPISDTPARAAPNKKQQGKK